MCPPGWACNDPSVNSSDLKLWKLDDDEFYYRKINASFWEKIRYTSILSYLRFISSEEDTVVLYDLSDFQSVILNSTISYSGKDIFVYSTKPFSGSWLFVYYEADSDFY